MANLRRINKEYKEIIETGNQYGIEKISDYQWKGMLKGPSGTPFVNGQYIVDIKFPNEYPLKPPKIYFVNPPYCLNVCGHNDYHNNDENKKSDDNNTGQNMFGYISLNKLNDFWSPALKMNVILNEIYDFCFYECGYDDQYNVDHPPINGTVYLNKYKLYLQRPREFLYNVSSYNELYGNGDKATYFILPQMNEMDYFKNVSVIDNILRDTYKCNEDTIENILQFHGKKANFGGLYNEKFTIPQFDGIEDNYDTEIVQRECKATIWRRIDEIETDISNAKEKGNAFEMRIFGIIGCANRLYFDACDSLTVADIKVIYNNKQGYPIHNLRMTFAGKVLEDIRELRDYNIQKDSTVYFTFRMYGG